MVKEKSKNNVAPLVETSQACCISLTHLCFAVDGSTFFVLFFLCLFAILIGCGMGVPASVGCASASGVLASTTPCDMIQHSNVNLWTCSATGNCFYLFTLFILTAVAAHEHIIFGTLTVRFLKFLLLSFLGCTSAVTSNVLVSSSINQQQQQAGQLFFVFADRTEQLTAPLQMTRPTRSTACRKKGVFRIDNIHAYIQ